VQTLGRCGRSAPRPADRILVFEARVIFRRPNAAQLQKFNFRQTGKPRLASCASENRVREDHYTPEKFRMECVWENLLRRYLSAVTAENLYREACFLELAKGIEPPTL
jgi:hypothetical protein